ncbi:hypothetical protein FisN_2Hh545 [Fistulifera solaris]|uniref:Uncharacterized protein n=1 Tax=Fistulifera solaris TaxID=1519565 RepID=A0A1Z5JI84_FISSO|nr:hypothetical protein FisN_2Hh545 [Fistulifera solaris]|eukprot:GAX13709.1 hypothetical protein FisN_2Hh545 [Fistulifera solaris]
MQFAKSDFSEEEDDSNSNNPYADPNYPDLEFVDYSDPEYTADSGNYDDLYDNMDEDSTEAEIEAMREERRVKNDIFQFNTYYANTYQNGATFAGEWTVYKINWSPNNSDEVPTLSQFKHTFPVTTRLEADEQGRWVHIEDYHVNATTDNNSALDWDDYYKPYWPTTMIPFDFRGQQGNMVCGDAWTVCQALNAAQESVIEGPFVEYRAEVGLSYGSLMRYRLKLDYSAKTDQADQQQLLQLKYLTVCREVIVEREMHWPRRHPNYEIQDALFGAPGAEGGLYDPPPIADGTENNYILLDLPGHATTLIPVVLDPSLTSPKMSWVTSLDWTPGKMRYQVDRKVNSGKELLGLRSLELSEVQAADAEEYRPRDGGQDMRQ